MRTIIFQQFCLALVYLTLKVVAELSGDHICETEESFTYNVTEYYPTNITIRNYKWCMGFPPRCSFYTYKTIQRSKIVERVGIRPVQKCCPGFRENENHDGCISLCEKCVEGVCDYGKCICRSGFEGEDCSVACQQGRWGPNCKYDCSCGLGVCDRHDGKCKCPEGYHGLNCDQECENGYYGENCEGKCLCLEDETCDIRTGECTRTQFSVTNSPTTQQTPKETRSIHYKLNVDLTSTLGISSRTSTPQLQKYHTFNDDSTSEITQDTTLPTSTTTMQSIFLIPTTKEDQILNISFMNNGQFVTTKYKNTHAMIKNFNITVLNETNDNEKVNKTFKSPPKYSHDKTTVTSKENYKFGSNSKDTSFIQESTKSLENTVPITTEIVHPSKTIFMPSLNFTTDSIKFTKASLDYSKDSVENVLSEEAEEMDYTMSDTIPIGTHISIIIILTVILLLIMVSIIIFYHKKAKIRRKIRDVHYTTNSSNVPSVSIYTRSIFHTPLPDLPKFENPVSVAENDSEKTFETHVVCSMSFSNQIFPKEETEFTYDHPPSTGSYKAASIPEPPEIEPLIEPVYDEIPINGRSCDAATPPPSYNSSIYMNTCGKTRL